MQYFALYSHVTRACNVADIILTRHSLSRAHPPSEPLHNADDAEASGVRGFTPDINHNALYVHKYLRVPRSAHTHTFIYGMMNIKLFFFCCVLQVARPLATIFMWKYLSEEHTHTKPHTRTH